MSHLPTPATKRPESGWRQAPAASSGDAGRPGPGQPASGAVRRGDHGRCSTQAILRPCAGHAATEPGSEAQIVDVRGTPALRGARAAQRMVLDRGPASVRASWQARARRRGDARSRCRWPIAREQGRKRSQGEGRPAGSIAGSIARRTGALGRTERSSSGTAAEGGWRRLSWGRTPAWADLGADVARSRHRCHRLILN